MQKMILTSTGFDNPQVVTEFKNMLNKPIEQIKCLFVPTAANDKESQEIIPLCFNELVEIGILAGNIITYNCNRYISNVELKDYDVIYFCGGDEAYLMKKINECGIADELKKAVKENLIFIGVSAGSMIASTKINDNLNGLDLVSIQINPHATKNIVDIGTLFNKKDIINLADQQAIIVSGKHMHVV